jgi:hypothetical protein
MGSRALEFSRAHQDQSSGYGVAVAQLEEQLQRSRELAARQLEGFVEVRAASARKVELTRSMRRQQLVHLARVARRASREAPELAQKFVLPRDPAPYLPFKTMTGNMAAEAQRQKELLVKHGLVERVLDSLTESLQEFDAVTEQGAAGRRVHVGASADLDVVADEVVQIVKVIDGLNRFRFAQDPELLAAWKSASNVTDSRRQPEKTPPQGDQAKPAA